MTTRIALALLGLVVLVATAKLTHANPVLCALIGLVYGYLAMAWVMSKP